MVHDSGAVLLQDVWRDLRHDFGGDLLAEHYKSHVHPHPAR